ncbi:LuxR C-terminal-related transcriptional regulator [Pseudofrankia asymbiotica]|uniref:HTH luxR-type domain-containing protein n=1 Tax=Pseudofrankia asymbiotica TaxID=1834516 RepID=A0A1V2I2G4_9ACTN|nr:LuxR C-terminal-related transcriptional regulator [Pseudofrankia asymbiotica]ONH24364.1 hypothetical protein BL253_30580 [Pseudofrankia asymbiotica]
MVERHIAALERACREAENGDDLFGDVSERLRQILPFDCGAWFGTDPATVLGTFPVRVENVESGHCESYWERECRVEDVLLFRDVARSKEGVGTLYAATDDNPARSARWREFIAPQGYGDELRAAFRLGGGTWGVVDLMRDKHRPAFSAADVKIMRAVVPAVATALRGFATRDAGQGSRHPADSGPGTALYDDAGLLLSLDENAERLFMELAGPSWSPSSQAMTPVRAVVARAASVAAGRDRGPAAARLRASSGRWLSVHASCLRRPGGEPGPTALIIEPAKSSQIAPIIVEAYRLTVREQEITRAIARGLSNPEIAAELFLSPHTVRDHLKTIFAKVGVGSRGELIAKLFAEHYGPVIHAPGAPVAHSEF